MKRTIEENITEEKEVLRLEDILDTHTSERIKPALLRDVKTEALLVFSRTALERFFKQIYETQHTPEMSGNEDTKYIYENLERLRDVLQTYVVNVDYLLNLVKYAPSHSQVKRLAKFEEPLIHYYDAMAQKVANHYKDRAAKYPEFLIICILSHWILEEGKSIDQFPFLKEFDFEMLIEKFENNRSALEDDGECILSEIHSVSIAIVEKLKNRTYKMNKTRVSKSRKK